MLFDLSKLFIQSLVPRQIAQAFAISTGAKALIFLIIVNKVSTALRAY
jgi:hypothetical protein